MLTFKVISSRYVDALRFVFGVHYLRKWGVSGTRSTIRTSANEEAAVSNRDVIS
jgi:hypothetical protein